MICLLVAYSLIASQTLQQQPNGPFPVVNRWSVVPVTFDQPLSLRNNAPGDTFRASVTDDNGLFPRHTHFDGHVVAIDWGNRYRPPSMDLRFDDVVLPDGSREEIDAVPVPLNAKFVHRGRDGRFYADDNWEQSRNYPAVGAIGGLVVGSLFNRPFLGSFLGFLGGIIAADSARENSDLVAKKGSKVGALFQEDAPVGGPRITDNGPKSPWPDRGFEVRIEDRAINFPQEEMPYWSGDILMVPLSFMAQRTHVSVDWIRDGGIIVRGAGNELRVKQDSEDFKLNDGDGQLPAPVQLHDRITYVPVDIFGWVSDREVFVNGDRLAKNPG